MIIKVSKKDVPQLTPEKRAYLKSLNYKDVVVDDECPEITEEMFQKNKVEKHIAV